jgi:integrase
MTTGTTLASAMGKSTKPLNDSSVQAAMRATVLALGWDKRHGKRPVTCHTLRHCFATHLLDAGVSIRLVSQYLGHSSLKPTLVYLHLTEVSESAAREVIAKFPGL